eukprot:gene32446-5424_t
MEVHSMDDFEALTTECLCIEVEFAQPPSPAAPSAPAAEHDEVATAAAEAALSRYLDVLRLGKWAGALRDEGVRSLAGLADWVAPFGPGGAKGSSGALKTAPGEVGAPSPRSRLPLQVRRKLWLDAAVTNSQHYSPQQYSPQGRARIHSAG